MRNNLKKRILSFLLAVVMVVGLVPNAGMTAYATETVSGNSAGEGTGKSVSLNAVVEEQKESVSANAAQEDNANNGIMLLAEEGIAAIDEMELPITENVIDITDKTVASWSRYTNKVTNIAISGGTVKSASEDGTNVNILMDGTTDPNAELTVTFGKSVGKGSLSQDTDKIVLENGEAVVSITVNSSYVGSILKGSVTYTIHFTSEPAGTAEVEGVALDKTKVEISETKTAVLKATVSPTDAKSRKVIWSSEDETIATVNEKGVVTGIKEGTTTITAASDVDSAKFATCTVTVLPVPDNVLLLDIPTSNGSVDSVEFTDANGEVLDVISVELQDKTIHVVLSKNVDPASKVTATFELTQNSSGLPFVTPNNAFNRAWDYRTNVYNTTLSAGRGKAAVYLYNSTPKATNNSYVTYTINYELFNNLPELANGDISSKTEEIAANDELKINLAGLFADKDGETLTYKYSADGTAYTAFEGEEYVYTQNIPGEYKLYFKANDGLADSEDIYTVTVTVTNSNVLYSVDVDVPEDIIPSFYITKEFGSDGVDVLSDALVAEKGETVDGFTGYTVKIPENISQISYRSVDTDDVNWGGMSFATKDSEGNTVTSAFTLGKVQGKIIDFAQKETEGTVSAAYGNYKAVQGKTGYLLVTGVEYTYTANPASTSTYKTADKTETLLQDTGIHTVIIEVPYNNAKTITVPNGAKAQLYLYNKYYSFTEFEPLVQRENNDGTTTFYFSASGDSLVYRVSMPGKITKAGYWEWGKENTIITYTDEDWSSSVRPDYSVSSEANAGFAEDNVLLNINGQNNLVMSVGGTKTLKAYRAWEIIPVSYNNWIITPDFHFNILQGEDVVSLTDKDSPSSADGDWKTLTALKEGTAIIEVTYDAVEVEGGSYDGVYGASDPARTGLAVVQVGEHAEVDFGIDCFAGQGSMDYASNTSKAWDAEFDTLYFTGSNGELKFSPTAANAVIQRVQISNDKGNSWNTLMEKDGIYTAKIAHGNNIIRVITDSGEAYQVVRGYKVDVNYKITNDNGNGTVDAGETVRVTLNGLHQPIPKMAGTYNPGYRANMEGDGGTHISYIFNGEKISGGKAQYTFKSEANYIDVTIPADTTETSFTLSNGCIGLGVVGLTTFADGGDSHRNIPDGGCTTRGSETTFHTRSILPEITINIGDQSSPNSAPRVSGDAITEAQIELGQKFAVNPETLFTDADGDVLTYTVSVSGAAAVAVDKTYKFTPDGVGTYELAFTATDGKLTAPQHTVTLTVVAATQKDDTLTFDITGSDIKGYVTVGFEDNGVREEGAAGLKFPVALGTVIEATRVPFAEGDTIAEVTLRLLDAKGIGYEYSGTAASGGGFYLGAIKNFIVDDTPYEKLGQFDAGEGSGWMITSNDWFIDKGASEYLVQSGDRIQWKYTCQLGADIGDNSWEKVVGEVEALIDAIGSPVTLDSIDRITAAREAYDALSDFYQSKVDNYNDLLAAEKTLAGLIESGATQDDKDAAAAADALIDAIGDVTLKSADKIEEARKAYEALTSLQKQLVTRLEFLETAENQLKQLNSASHEEIYKAAGNYLENLGTPGVGATGGEWMVIGLARSDREVSDGYYNGVVQYLEDTFKDSELKEDVKLHADKSTENSRVILALTSLGIDPSSVEGYNLFQGLDEMNYVTYQGINGAFWALLALNSHPNHAIPGDEVTTQALIDVILAKEVYDGGWTLYGSNADVDMTGMAIQALAPYYDFNAEVKAAVDRALNILSKMQREDGSFAATQNDGSYIPTAESTAQVIVALTALGINPEEDARFIKKGMSAVDALCTFAVDGGGFMHTADGSRDGMATEQGYYALVSYFRLLNGKTSLYDMSDVTLTTGQVNENVASAYDKEKAKPVEKLIEKIGKVDIFTYPKIEAARAAYNKLTVAQKALVSNYQTLLGAEKSYQKQADDAVALVERKIQEIGSWADVTLETRSRIHTARKLYNMLPKYLRDQVDMDIYVHLLGAEQIYETLQAEALAMFEDGVLILSKSELLELQEKFAAVTEDTSYDDALELMRTWHKLGEEQQLAFQGIEAMEILQKILAAENHEDPTTGIKAEGLEWNIRLIAEFADDDEKADELQGRLTDCDLLSLFDLYLEDVLTGERYTLEEAVEIQIPTELVGSHSGYARLAILHELEDGKLEIFNCEVTDEYVVFDAVEFSLYGVLGFAEEAAAEEVVEENAEGVELKDEEPAEDAAGSEESAGAANSGNWLIWAVLAVAAMAVLSVLIALKKRTAEEAE